MTDESFGNDSAQPSLSRRKLITMAAVATTLAGRSNKVVANPPEHSGNGGRITESARTPGSPPSPLGMRSTETTLTRKPALNIASMTPLEDLHGTLTPADLHFERHHAGIPDLHKAEHKLLIHGLAERALSFSLQDLLRFPAVTRTCFIECSGNYFPRAGELSAPHMICGLTSQSEWTGVPVSSLLREVGMRDNARWLIAEGADAALLNRSIPVSKALDDALIVYAQNGEPLRPSQGYPIRLLLPGWEGNTNVKWLRRIELSDVPAMSRQETSKYTETMRDGTIRHFSFEQGVRSIITSPAYPNTIEPGWHEIRGLAWSGGGKITAVEVSTDGGKQWQQAQLQGPILAKAHTRFGLQWHWDGTTTEIMSRAVDETGAIQPTLKQIYADRGLGSGFYHLNPITGWIVRGDGELRFNPTG